MPLLVPAAPSDPPTGSTQSSPRAAVVTWNRGDAPAPPGGAVVVGLLGSVVVGCGPAGGAVVDGVEVGGAEVGAVVDGAVTGGAEIGVVVGAG